NSQIGIALGGINLPSLTSSGVQIRGAIRLSGASSTFADTYITTKVAGGGSPVPALISAVNYDPGSGGQVIAAGVPVGSDGNARAISGFDARTSAHQPTIAVLSPGETQIAGFSWDGSDTTFLTKTSSANMVLQANSLNILTLQNVSSAARLGIGNGSPAYALDVTGDANLSSGSAYKINGTDICTGSGCTPVTTCNVSGNYICNGGNTPVSSVAIGTTNAQPLNFMTNGSTRGSFSSAGIFQVNGNGTGTARIGGDCSSNYTAINLGGTTPFDCTSYNFLSGPTDTSLYINRPSGSSIFMREGNSSTNHLSIAGGGAFTAQNTTDTTAGFRVLNAGSVPLFQIDTSLTRVYIGNPTGDTTGALLVLDTKTDASDPTGVDGGMYFNSFYKRLRCYYDGQWRFCNDPVGLTYGFNLEEDFVGGGPNVGSHNWTTSLGSGGAASVIQGAAAIPDLAARPGQVRLSLGTVSTGVQYASIWLNGNSTEPVILGNTNGTRIEVEFAANMPNLADATNDFNVHMGLCNNSPDNGCNDGIYFEYDRDQSVNWRYGAANNSSRTLTNSSTAVTTGWHRFKMVFTYSSSGPTATIDYYVDGTLIGTHTNTNVPTTRSTQPQFDIMRDSGAGTTDRQLIVDYFQYRSSFTSAR
ncbi:MAG TPA: LamG-like jellyroll fold domain-containing protein, partial [Candidatus Saccharimonadales bacterium]